MFVNAAFFMLPNKVFKKTTKLWDPLVSELIIEVYHINKKFTASSDFTFTQ